MCSLLAVIPQTGIVAQADDSRSAMNMVENRCPDLLLLDFGLVGASTVLQRLKEKCPGTRRLVMAHDVDQKREAQFSGADAVVLVGTAPWELASIVTQLCQDYPG